MKRPVSISIDRLVLPARYAGQETAFTRSLTGALQDRLDIPHDARRGSNSESERLAGRTAEAILRKGRGTAND